MAKPRQSWSNTASMRCVSVPTAWRRQLVFYHWLANQRLPLLSQYEGYREVCLKRGPGWTSVAADRRGHLTPPPVTGY